MAVSFKEIVNLCIENKVDFEVSHGYTTHKRHNNIRRQIQFSFPNTPGIFATFGDEKNGEQVGRIIVSGNRNLTLKSSELVEILSAPVDVARPWRATEMGNEITSESNLTVLDPNKRTVLVTGRVGDLIKKSDESYIYEVTLETPYVIAGGKEYFVSETVINVTVTTPIGKGEKIYGAGMYSYPSMVTMI